ncbi:MAG: hypothetical protein WC730_04060 [Patescibacteria group bacterium]|jgi:hypothetical protein
MRNLLKIFSLFSAITFLGVGCDSPTSIDHSDWQTYTDVTRGFSIQYPEDASVDLETTLVDLPAAIGEKERQLKIDVSSFTTVDLDGDGCLNLSLLEVSKEKLEINSTPVCLTILDEGAAGSTYRTYHYTTVLADQTVADIMMLIHYPTSVRVYAGCENDADQTKQECIDLAFDEARDTALFDEIIATFQKK